MQFAAKGLKYYWKLLLSLSDILSSLWTNWDWRLKAESFLFQTELFLRSQIELFLRSSMLPRGRFPLKIFLLTLRLSDGTLEHFKYRYRKKLLENFRKFISRAKYNSKNYEFVKILKSVIYVFRLNSDEKYFKKPRNGHFQITIAWELFK